MASKNRDNTNITVSSAGAINYPVQPAFFAHLSSSVGNVTITAVLRVLCSGTTKTVGVDGQATDPLTWFSGMLVA